MPIYATAYIDRIGFGAVLTPTGASAPPGGGVITPPAADGALVCYALVVSEERHLFAIGADNHPTRVRWSDQENFNVWTPTELNKAGGYTLLTGSKLRCGKRARGQVLIWSDTELFSFFPSSRVFVYGYERIGNNCGVAGMHAVAAVGDTMFWMGPDDFWTFDGVPRPIDCDVYDYVFRDMNLVQRAKFHAGVNVRFDEVWFWYVSAAGTEVDRCVSYNYRNNTWAKHDMPRLAWEDKGVFPRPFADTAAGTVYTHENGLTADGAPLASFVESFPAEIGVGDRVQAVRALVPDLNLGSGSVDITLKGRFSPAGAEDVFGPFHVDAATERVFLTTVARQMSVRVAASTPADYWELGTVRLEVKAGGLR